MQDLAMFTSVNASMTRFTVKQQDKRFAHTDF